MSEIHSKHSWMMRSSSQVLLIQLMDDDDDDDVVTNTCVGHPTHQWWWWCCHKHLCRSCNSSMMMMMLSQALVSLMQLIDDDVITSTCVTHPTHRWWCHKHLFHSSMNWMMMSQASTCVCHLSMSWMMMSQVLVSNHHDHMWSSNPTCVHPSPSTWGINLFMISNFAAEHHNFLQMKKKLLPPDSLTHWLQFDPAPLQPLSSQLKKPIIIIIHHHHHHLWRNPSWSSIIVHKENPSSMWGTLNHKSLKSPPPPYILTCTPTLYTSSCPAGISYRFESLANWVRTCWLSMFLSALKWRNRLPAGSIQSFPTYLC